MGPERPAPPTHPWYALVGPTGSGKSAAGVVLAERLSADVVSVDSMTVYRHMDVGTAKPSAEERARVPHHLVDVADPEEPFSVRRYQALAREALAQIADREGRVLLVGGSGLYFRAIVDDLEFPPTDPRTRGELEAEALAMGPGRLHRRLSWFDPEAARKIEPENVRRTVRALEVAAVTGRPFSSFARAWERYRADRVRAAGVLVPPPVLYRRIEARVRAQVEAGLLDEVRLLMDRGFSGWLTSSQAIGYAEMVEHLSGHVTLDEAVARTTKRTKALARRQLAWFRRDPRIRWFPAAEDGAPGVAREIEEYLVDG